MTRFGPGLEARDGGKPPGLFLESLACFLVVSKNSRRSESTGVRFFVAVVGTFQDFHCRRGTLDNHGRQV